MNTPGKPGDSISFALVTMQPGNVYTNKTSIGSVRSRVFVVRGFRPRGCIYPITHFRIQNTFVTRTGNVFLPPWTNMHR